jgi:two-component system, cell cycle response regulator DivK
MRTTILLIEDNEQNRYLATFLLEQSGHVVVHAPDGPTGLDLATRGSFDLVLLDIQLPGMDGYAVARALRANPALAQVPIVAVTSFAMAGDREKALASGCTGYIEKPIDPETFVVDVVRHVRQVPSTTGGGEA